MKADAYNGNYEDRYYYPRIIKKAGKVVEHSDWDIFEMFPTTLKEGEVIQNLNINAQFFHYYF